MLKKRITAILLVTVMLLTATMFITALAAWEEDTDTPRVTVETDNDGNVTGSVPDSTDGVDEWRLVETETESGAIYADEPEIIGYRPGDPIYEEEYLDGYENGDPIYGEEVEGLTEEDLAEFDENWEIFEAGTQEVDDFRIEQQLTGYEQIPVTGDPEEAGVRDYDASDINDSRNAALQQEEGHKINDKTDIENRWGHLGVYITGNGSNAKIVVPEGVTIIVRLKTSDERYIYVSVSGPMEYEPPVNGTNAWICDAFDNRPVTYIDGDPIYEDVEIPVKRIITIYGAREILGYEQKPIYKGGELIGYIDIPIYGERPIIGYWEIIRETYARFIWVDEAGEIIPTPAGETPVIVPAEAILTDAAPAPAPAAAAEGEDITVDVTDPVTPLADAPQDDEETETLPVVDVDDIGTPLASAPMGITPLAGISSWHLWNLIFSAATVILALAMGIRVIAGNKKEDEDQYGGDKDARKKRVLLSLAIPAAAIAACIVFFLTQDLNAPMAMVDMWTVLHAGLFAAGLVSFIFADRKAENEEEQAEAKA